MAGVDGVRDVRLGGSIGIETSQGAFRRRIEQCELPLVYGGLGNHLARAAAR